jgi:predicted dehydrogenase
MSDLIRIGILGTGNIAARAVLGPVRQVTEVAVVAVASRDSNKAAAYAAANSIPRHCDYDGLLADPNVDVVYITLPNGLHAEWSIRALEAGKHVLCEKPMASNEAEAKAIAETVRRTERVFMEAFHFPYHPFFKRVRDMLDTRAIGRMTHVNAEFEIPGSFIPAGDHRLSYAMAGGALMDAGCYPLYALRLLAAEVESVASASAELDSTDAQVDLRMRANLALAGGIGADFVTSFLAKDKPTVDLVLTGEDGRLVVKLLVLPHLGATLRLEWRGQVYEEFAESTPSYEYQLRELVRSVSKGAPVLTSADGGALNMRAIDSIYSKAGLHIRGQARTEATI